MAINFSRHRNRERLALAGIVLLGIGGVIAIIAVSAWWEANIGTDRVPRWVTIRE